MIVEIENHIITSTIISYSKLSYAKGLTRMKDTTCLLASLLSIV